MKTADMEGSKLAEFVARANGWIIELEGEETICFDDLGQVHSFGQFGYRPDSNWHEAGPIIERESICIFPNIDGTWNAYVYPLVKDFYIDSMEISSKCINCKHPLIAAMRAYVVSKFGAEVPD